MSDFISRVAARAAGQAPSARPRLPSRIEPFAAGIIELAETEIAAPSRGAHETARETPPARAAAEAAPTPEPAPAPARARPSAAQPAPAGTRRPSVAVPAEPGPPAERAERETASVLSTDAAIADEPAPPPIAPARPARPVVRAAPSAPAAAPSPSPHAPAAIARGEEPAVRVHIGRLEVRATLQEMPAATPARERLRPQELSLGDYLRGKKVAT